MNLKPAPCFAASCVDPYKIADYMKALAAECHGRAARNGWWTNLKTGESLLGKRNVGEMLMLIVSEIAEADHGYELDLNDDKLPHRPMFIVELADTVIRVADLAPAIDIDIQSALFTVAATEKPQIGDIRLHRHNPKIGDIRLHRHNPTIVVWRELLLLVRHVAFAMEAHRKSKPDHVYPDHSGIAVALARVVLACFQMAEQLGFDLGEIILEKLYFNDTRADHKPENRLREGGKAY